MKDVRIPTILILLLAGSLVLSCEVKRDSGSSSQVSTASSNHGQAGVVDENSKANILRIARNSPDHTTLAAAIEAAEIENVLVNAGPLTVFAPTNAAFEALPDGTVEELMKPENKQKLAKILTSHASPANLKKSQLTEDTQVYLATGQYVDVERKDGEIYVNGAKVLGTIDASNGWIHVVDKVFLFPEEED
ncbi:MAG: fasciclin domain-containing protein [Balneolaceae bacterium]|nr:fasciclin domain-containing protein [Balneolaceae bacterium]